MFKFYIVFCFWICFVLGAKAQVKVAYFIDDTIIGDSTIANAYAVYGKLESEDIYTFKKYDLYDNLLISGSFLDDKLTIPHGKFIHYSDVYEFNQNNHTNFIAKDRDRFIVETGNYVNGLQQGKFYNFYPDGKIMVSIDFLNGKKEGDFLGYDTKGNLVTYGKYINNKKEGEWKFKRGRKTIFYINDVEQKPIKGRIKI